MEIILSPKQFTELRLLSVHHPTDTGNDAMDLRNLPLHLERLWEIIGREIVCQALATGEPVKIRVDFAVGPEKMADQAHGDHDGGERLLSGNRNPWASGICRHSFPQKSNYTPE